MRERVTTRNPRPTRPTLPDEAERKADHARRVAEAEAGLKEVQPEMLTISLYPSWSKSTGSYFRHSVRTALKSSATRKTRAATASRIIAMSV
jgi:hypothetical protein